MARTGFVFIYALKKSRETFLTWRRYGHMVTHRKDVNHLFVVEALIFRLLFIVVLSNKIK